MKATFYLSSGQIVEVRATGDMTVVRDGNGYFQRLTWDGDLKRPVPVIWPSGSEVVMLTLD